jgi:hypothetical protein
MESMERKTSPKSFKHLSGYKKTPVQCRKNAAYNSEAK